MGNKIKRKRLAALVLCAAVVTDFGAVSVLRDGNGGSRRGSA